MDSDDAIDEIIEDIKFLYVDLEGLCSNVSKCIICYQNFKEGEKVRCFSSCNHIFHSECCNDFETRGTNLCPYDSVKLVTIFDFDYIGNDYMMVSDDDDDEWLQKYFMEEKGKGKQIDSGLDDVHSRLTKCQICMMYFPNSVHMILILPCGHTFHADCWYECSHGHACPSGGCEVQFEDGEIMHWLSPYVPDNPYQDPSSSQSPSWEQVDRMVVVGNSTMGWVDNMIVPEEQSIADAIDMGLLPSDYVQFGSPGDQTLSSSYVHPAWEVGDVEEEELFMSIDMPLSEMDPIPASSSSMDPIPASSSSLDDDELE